ncbi:MAG: type II secretion system F family protein [Candidatus Micrarchaeia archaeon]|jgi:Flp pilus assembly protein TadB
MGEIFSALVRTLSPARDLSGFFPQSALASTCKALAQSGLPFSAGEYLSFCLAASLLACVAAFLPVLLLLGFSSAFAFSLLAFGAALFLLLRVPREKARSRALEIERELSMALGAMHASLLFNPDFEKSLEFAARGGFGELSAEFSRVLRDVSAGVPVNSALSAFADRVDSIHARRAGAQLAFTYDYGLAGDGLQKLASELASLERVRARKHAAKTAFWGMVFIASSCIIPAFFSAYASVGSLFLDTQITPRDVVFAFVFVFPAVNAGILLFIKSRSPRTIATE